MRQSEGDEVTLLRASTRKDEFRWYGTAEEVAVWEQALEASKYDDVPPMAFTLQLSSALRLMVEYGEHAPRMSLQGPSLSKASIAKANEMLCTTVEKAIAEGMEHIVFEAFTSSQILLSEQNVEDNDYDAIKDDKEIEAPQQLSSAIAEMRRVIFWTHHLKAPSKKRDMNKWCSELEVFGVVKSGFPGFLCFEGPRDGVDEIVRRIKALQWQAITVKTDVLYTIERRKGNDSTDTLLQACMSFGHSSVQTYNQGKGSTKLRTCMDEIEETGPFVERLRQAAIPEDEIMFALNLRS